MSEGFYEIYLDGTLHVSGYNLSKNAVIEGKGIFVVGQEQDNVGGKCVLS
jgi:Pentaxin family